MNAKMITPFILPATIILAIWTVPKILAGDIISILVVVVLVTAIVLKVSESVWIGVVLGCLTFGIQLPYHPLLEKVTFDLLVVTTVMVYVLFKGLITQNILGDRALLARESKLMMFAAIIILARLLYDRPFSADWGSRGGGGQAIYFLIGVFAYFIMMKITLTSWDTSRNLRALIFTSAASFFATMIIGRLLESGLDEGILGLVMGASWPSTWLLCPLLLAMAIYRKEMDQYHNPFINIWIAVIIGVTIFFGVTAPFRSRPYFAVAMILSVAFAFRKEWKIIPIVALIFSGILVVTSIGVMDTTDEMARTLSTIVTSTERQRLSGEIGWTSQFRLNLLELALDEIKQSPILGKGFAFSRDVLLSALLNPEDTVANMAMVGGYHNSIIQLAVACGLPCTLAFLFAYVLNMKNYLSYVRNSQHNQLHLMATAILAYFVVRSGQMLINGGGDDFFQICVLMGIMSGLSLKGNTHEERKTDQEYK
jgi:O-antigen ligase